MLDLSRSSHPHHPPQQQQQQSNPLSSNGRSLNSSQTSLSTVPSTSSSSTGNPLLTSQFTPNVLKFDEPSTLPAFTAASASAAAPSGFPSFVRSILPSVAAAASQQQQQQHKETSGGFSASPNPSAAESTSSSSSFTPSFLKTARHPKSCIFHLLFKLLAILTFLFGSFLFGGWKGDYVFSFVTTTLFLSLDFWTVKNITGRLLVGMRWWSDVGVHGKNEWFFESHTDERVINLTDKTVFWLGLYLWPIVWIVFFIVYLLRLQVEWLLLDCIGIVLSSANLVGYWRCSREARKRVEQWTAATTTLGAMLSRFV